MLNIEIDFNKLIELIPSYWIMSELLFKNIFHLSLFLRGNGKFVSVSFFFSFPYLQIEVCARVCVRVAHTKKLHTLLVDLTYRGYLTSDQI